MCVPWCMCTHTVYRINMWGGKSQRRLSQSPQCSLSLLSAPCSLIFSENMVRGLDEDETNFLDEVSRQQELIEKQRREEELEELKEYRISFVLGEKWLAFLTNIKRPST